MKRTSFGDMECPIARGLEQVGEWWSILILRDAFHGLRRFDEFRESLGVAPNMLSRRLNALVKSGLLERRRYSAHPPRFDYVLTAKGRDFHTVLLALLDWGNRHFARAKGPAVLPVDRDTGMTLDLVMVDRSALKPLHLRNVRLAAGPGAGPEVHRRLARIAGGRGIKEGAS